MLNIIKALQIFWNISSVKPKLALAFLLQHVVQRSAELPPNIAGSWLFFPPGRRGSRSAHASFWSAVAPEDPESEAFWREPAAAVVVLVGTFFFPFYLLHILR